MKFSVGDFVSYIESKRHGALEKSFVDRWGYGPFKIIMIDQFDSIYLATLDGQILEQTPGGRPWSHSEGGLQIEQFLTAARKAIADETR